ncbi:carbonic anhydrase 2-like [Apis laboriosa]|uniref:carbonic anhydrase 2-like n=1 Tax=Apis laboriosa TaxID=183418 RepID=UPI001CC3B752|nr:carbonic anhydrase 2-like [Apis laboriosa]
MLIKREKKAVIKPTFVSTSSTGLPKWRQSPIDLCRTFTWTKKLPPLYMTNYWSDMGTVKMTNTGRTVVIEISDRSLPFLRGGPLKDEFQFMNVQFRWGAENSCGAEHSINGIWYSMEAQVMHWNTRYGSIDKCYDKPDGIAVLSYFMQVVGCPGIPDNPSLAEITNNLSKIKLVGSQTTISPYCLLWMLEGCKGHSYYTYKGSLTTPPYQECVIWIISPIVNKISVRQIDAFRSLYDGKLKNILKNNRSQQRLHRRMIYHITDDAAA